MLEDLINRLKQYKAERNLSWEEVAEGVGLSYSTITKLAWGEKKNPTMGTVQAIESYLKDKKTKAA